MSVPLQRDPAGGGIRKTLGGFLLAALVSCVALWLHRESQPPRQTPAETAPAIPAPPAETLSRTLEFDAVFGRALWRRPQPDDLIKNAERRDWSDSEGVTRWDWFLEILPGASLQTWFDTNPFSLRKIEGAVPQIPAAEAARPEWFPKEASFFEVFQSSTSSFLMLRDPATKKIYLSDSGGGLARPISQ